jgi:nitrate/nitrite transporter NarK
MKASGIFGRIIVGYAADRYGRIQMYKLSFGMMALSAFYWPFAFSLLSVISANL